MELLVSDTPNILIESATERFVALVGESKGLRELRVLITGGTLGIEFLRALGTKNLDLTNVTFIFGDERFVSLTAEDRNEAQGIHAWPALKNHLIRYPDIDSDLSEACEAFNSQMEGLLGEIESEEPAFDLVILGMGPDGHIASLFPGSEHGSGWIVSESSSPKPPAERLSFSYQALNRGRQVWFLVSGEAKAEAVRCAISPDCSLPAGRVKGLEQTLWFVDRELKLAL